MKQKLQHFIQITSQTYANVGVHNKVFPHDKQQRNYYGKVDNSETVSFSFLSVMYQCTKTQRCSFFTSVRD